MGIDPNDTFTYWLPADRSKPESERRGFVYRHGTSADWRRFTEDKRKAEKLTNEAYFDAVLDLCKRGLQGWTGFDRPFDGAIDELLTEGQMIEMVDELRFASTMAELEKKRSSRQSTLPADGSVKAAPAASAPS